MNTKAMTPTYFAEYAPEKNLGVRLQLLAPREKHNIGFRSRSIVPLPLLPDPWGESSALLIIIHHQLKKVSTDLIVAVYPKPFKQGYFFTPSQVSLEIAGKSLYPSKVTRHYTVNLDPKKQDLDITRERLKVPHTLANLTLMLSNLMSTAWRVLTQYCT